MTYRIPRISAREITPRDIYLSRRNFLGAAAGTLLLGNGAPADAAALTGKPSAYIVEEKLTEGSSYDLQQRL